jgi:hypothetical protein
MKSAIINEEGRLLCPDCTDSELSYCQTYKIRDAYRARFDKNSDTLFMVGKPLMSESYATESSEESLRCIICENHFSVPWSQDSECEQSTVAYEGDYLRKTKQTETGLNQCPKCGKTDKTKILESYEVSHGVLSVKKDDKQTTIITEDDFDVEYESGSKETYLECYACHTRWSVPVNAIIDI